MAAFDGGLFEYDPQISRRTRHQKHVTLNTSVTTKEVSLIFWKQNWQTDIISPTDDPPGLPLRTLM
jgi:hypothetical protein